MSDLASLTSLVTARAIEVSKLVAEQSLKQLSFHESSLSGFEGEDINLRRARYELSNAAKDLARLAQGPEDHILELAWSVS
jgi:6-hydroxytryprostatin B O-methyltransferase